VRRVGAGERVDDVDVLVLEVRGDLLAQALEVLLRDRLVDLAPPDAVLGSGFPDDELVLRRPAGVPAGVDDERSALGEPALAAPQRVRVKQRGRRVAVDAAGRAQTVRGQVGALQLRRGGDESLPPQIGSGILARFGSEASSVLRVGILP
jgi:hypothetical protein